MNQVQNPQLDAVQLESLALELDQLLREEKARLGQADARYLQQLIFWQRCAALSGRLGMLLCWFSWWWLVPCVLLLALAKILDNMEIGHNVLHGQYDFLRHPRLNSQQYEWDIACDAKSWQRTHNFEHHTYTNIIGLDRDYGYGLLRLSADLRWRLQNSWQFLTYLTLSAFFQWGIAYHELAAQRVFFGRKKADRHSQVSDQLLKSAFFTKARRQLLKDYLIYPLLCWPVALPVLLGNLAANLLRNWWTATVIFCGHFTAQAQVFQPADCIDESRGHWYYRQILGSSNFTGPRWLHILTGHLSCQIEHHLFPDLPAWRYPALCHEVRAIAQRYGIPYNSGSFGRQYLSVLQRILRYSRP
ncbi:MAG: fatty acid desaturase family protein [Chromatiaceae bacterium]|jgi:fatty acid desaturase